jgi:5-formyltetrahydrofolate cyclo-ligase
MEDQGVSRFPAAEGRIPSFAGAKLAAGKLAAHRLWKRARVVKANAATIKGALKHGRVVAGGYHYIEYGILVDAGKIDSHITVATTVHPIQILRQHLPVTDHDLPCDVIATPRAVIEIERQYERPRGILWDHLQPPRIREVPVLERMGYA